MAQTQVIIIYSLNQNKRRTVVIPDDDSHIPVHTANIQPGEAVLLGSLAEYKAIGPDAMLVNHTGKQPSNDRCVIHANGKINAVVSADPLIDTHPLGQIIHDTTGVARVGYTVTNGVINIPINLNNVVV